MKLIYLLSFLLYSISSAADLKIESISIIKSDQPKEIQEHMGDYIVEAKIRNVSKHPVQVQRYSVFNNIRHDKLVDNKVITSYETDFHKNNSICCHPPEFDVIAPNEIYILRYRDSSRNKGKQMLLTIKGKDKSIRLGHYLLELTKLDEKAQ